MGTNTIHNIGGGTPSIIEKRNPTTDDFATALDKFNDREARYVRQIIDVAYTKAKESSPALATSPDVLQKLMLGYIEDRMRETRIKTVDALEYFIIDLREK